MSILVEEVQSLLTLDHRRRIREEAGPDRLVRVQVVAGDGKPQLFGQRGGYFTKGLHPIYHSRAYGQRGWSNMRYVQSTRCVTVGVEWCLAQFGPELAARKLLKKG